MRQIIKGRIYDTQKAKFIVAYKNKFATNEPGYEEQSLFKTEKGSYFTYLKQNPGQYSMPPVMRSHDRVASIDRGEYINVISAGQALDLLQEWGEVELLKQHFNVSSEEA